jgi:hypothetical protein
MLVLATYPTSHAALKAEKVLKGAGFTVELIPVPRQIRSSCGFCLLVDLPGPPGALLDTGAEALWRALEPPPGSLRRTYEPYG